MPFNLTTAFDRLVDRCSAALVDNGQIVEMRYDGTRLGASESRNEQALSRAIGDGANVYAIWTRGTRDTEWTLEYIGQRKQEACRERLKQHLFRKAGKTESKLKRVRKTVNAGRRVAVTTILVRPPALRRAVEEALIDRHRHTDGWLAWNKHGRGNIS